MCLKKDSRGAVESIDALLTISIVLAFLSSLLVSGAGLIRSSEVGMASLQAKGIMQEMANNTDLAYISGRGFAVQFDFVMGADMVLKQMTARGPFEITVTTARGSSTFTQSVAYINYELKDEFGNTVSSIGGTVSFPRGGHTIRIETAYAFNSLNPYTITIQKVA